MANCRETRKDGSSRLEERNGWLELGDEDLLRPYEGEMESDQAPDTLERLYPEENRKLGAGSNSIPWKRSSGTANRESGAAGIIGSGDVGADKKGEQSDRDS